MKSPSWHGCTLTLFLSLNGTLTIPYPNPNPDPDPDPDPDPYHISSDFKWLSKQTCEEAVLRLGGARAVSRDDIVECNSLSAPFSRWNL